MTDSEKLQYAKAAIREIFKLLDDGDLVRDTSRDGELEHFAQQGLRIVVALKAGQQVLDDNWTDQC